MTSAIITKLSKKYPTIHTIPKKYLGPNALKVLEFWEKIENLSVYERKQISDRYWALDIDVQNSAIDAAWDAADEIVNWKIRCVACGAAYGATKMVVFGYATLELIGNVNNKVFYDLIMSYKKS